MKPIETSCPHQYANGDVCCAQAGEPCRPPELGATGFHAERELSAAGIGEPGAIAPTHEQFQAALSALEQEGLF